MSEERHLHQIVSENVLFGLKWRSREAGRDRPEGFRNRTEAIEKARRFWHFAFCECPLRESGVVVKGINPQGESDRFFFEVVVDFLVVRKIRCDRGECFQKTGFLVIWQVDAVPGKYSCDEIGRIVAGDAACVEEKPEEEYDESARKTMACRTAEFHSLDSVGDAIIRARACPSCSLIRPHFMRKVEISETVLFYDTDCGGVVSNIAYLRYVEKARAALFASLGLDLLSMEESQLFPVVIRSEIDYRFPARLGHEIRVSATLSAVDRVRATCEYSLTTTGADGSARLAAGARQIVALVQMPEGRPRRIPAEWSQLVD